MKVAIIQARMGSTRLPGKVLMKVDGKPLLSHQLDRVRRAKNIDEIVVATSESYLDDVIADFCTSYGIGVYRGSENDVLSRYYDCAKQYGAEIVIRLTADCPLVDPIVIDEVINKFSSDSVDYCGNTVPPATSMFPDGSDVEVFTMSALSRANSEVKDAHFREHVTFQFWRDDSYTKSQLTQDIDWSSYRFTVDYPEDFEVVEYLFSQFRKKNIFGSLSEIIHEIESNPVIKEKNSKYYFGQGWSQ